MNTNTSPQRNSWVKEIWPWILLGLVLILLQVRATRRPEGMTAKEPQWTKMSKVASVDWAYDSHRDGSIEARTSEVVLTLEDPALTGQRFTRVIDSTSVRLGTDGFSEWPVDTLFQGRVFAGLDSVKVGDQVALRFQPSPSGALKILEVRR